MKVKLVSLLFILFIITGLCAETAFYYDPLSHLVAGMNNFTFEGKVTENLTVSFNIGRTGNAVPTFDDIQIYASTQSISLFKYGHESFKGLYYGPSFHFTTADIIGPINSIYNISALGLGGELGYNGRFNKFCIVPFLNAGYNFTHNFFGDKVDFEGYNDDGDKVELNDFYINYGLRLGVVF